MTQGCINPRRTTAKRDARPPNNRLSAIRERIVTLHRPRSRSRGAAADRGVTAPLTIRTGSSEASSSLSLDHQKTTVKQPYPVRRVKNNRVQAAEGHRRSRGFDSILHTARRGWKSRASSHASTGHGCLRVAWTEPLGSLGTPGDGL